MKVFPWKYHIHDPNLQRNKITFFSESVRTIDNINIMRLGTGYLCLTLLSTMFRLYRDHQTYWGNESLGSHNELTGETLGRGWVSVNR